MATGIKGICFNENSQLNTVDFKHSHIRKFCDGTRHFTRLSSKIFDDVIYESIYAGSGMTDEIMGGSSKRYSSIISDSRNDIKRRSIDVSDCFTSNVKMVEVLREKKKSAEVMIKDIPPDILIQQKNLKNLDFRGENRKEIIIPVDEVITPIEETLKENKNTNDEVVADSRIVDVEKQDVEHPEVISLETNSSDNDSKAHDAKTDVQSEAQNNRFRSNSDCIGRTPRNSNQVDITSTPLYKEIYANNLRQYGFILAKKLGISNQSPRELRATYLQNRQKAELRRERSNSSYSDFGKRLSKPPSPTERRVSAIESPVTRKTSCENDDLPPKTRMQRSNTIGGGGFTVKEFPLPARMRRSNTDESLDRAKENTITSSHSRSVSDLTMKCSDSLINISEIGQEKDFQKAQLRRMKKLSNVELRRTSSSPLSSNHSSANSSIDAADPTTNTNIEVDSCLQKIQPGTFNDKEPSKKQPTSVSRRKHKNIRDPHKRLSVPIFNTNSSTNTSTSPPQLSRRLSLPLHAKTDSKNTMSSLSVPDLYHNSSFGKEQLMDAYCKQDVPRRKLSVESLRRHNEAKERLEWRMSKLKTFEGILSEANTFMKDVRTMNASKSTSTLRTTTITEETGIPE